MTTWTVSSTSTLCLGTAGWALLLLHLLPMFHLLLHFLLLHLLLLHLLLLNLLLLHLLLLHLLLLHVLTLHILLLHILHLHLLLLLILFPNSLPQITNWTLVKSHLWFMDELVINFGRDLSSCDTGVTRSPTSPVLAWLGPQSPGGEWQVHRLQT